MASLSFWRWFGRILVLMGLIQTALVLRDEIRGETTEGRNRYSAGVKRKQRDDPAKFRLAMAGHWWNALPLPLAGIIVLVLCRRISCMDLLSTDLQKSPALDELERHLNAEVEARRNPPE